MYVGGFNFLGMVLDLMAVWWDGLIWGSGLRIRRVLKVFLLLLSDGFLLETLMTLDSRIWRGCSADPTAPVIVSSILSTPNKENIIQLTPQMQPFHNLPPIWRLKGVGRVWFGNWGCLPCVDLSLLWWYFNESKIFWIPLLLWTRNRARHLP